MGLLRTRLNLLLEVGFSNCPSPTVLLVILSCPRRKAEQLSHCLLNTMNSSLNAVGSPARRGLAIAPFTHLHSIRRHVPSGLVTCTSSRDGRSRVSSDVACAGTKQKIEGLTTEFCNDFVCTSSPAVEQGVRSFARGLELLRLPPGLFAQSVQYSDGVRSFKGPAGYARLKWISENVQGPKVVSPMWRPMHCMKTAYHKRTYATMQTSHSTPQLTF